MYEAFIDLDELIVRCRDKSTKKFIQEAIACYRAGAYRSCIVSTWNAIVFDFLHKLRQLEQIGNNGDASTLLEDFKNKSSNSDFKGLWEFESKIPEEALKRFELISLVEQRDIIRLFEDRSRCAHPSMISLEEPFEATAELARYHLRSAVMNFLQYPPVQGQAAKDRICKDIKSENFPKIPEEAVRYFQKGPLANARFSLIKNLVRGLTTSLLTDDLPHDERERQFSALNAISMMYHQETVNILNDHLSNIILDKVTDKNWGKVIIYLKKITAWESISDPCKIKAKTFIERLKVNNRGELYLDFEDDFATRDFLNNEYILLTAIHIDFLKESVTNNLKNNSLENLLHLKECSTNYFKDNLTSQFVDSILQEQHPTQISEIVDEFINSKSFESANANAGKLSKFISLLNDEQREKVLDSFCNNDQIYGAWDCSHLIVSIFQDDRNRKGFCDKYWLSFRENLNKFQAWGNKDINKLINLIDSNCSKNENII